MAVTVSAQIVTVGAAPAAGLADPDGSAVAASLSAAGIPVTSRVFLLDDEGALEHALAPDDTLSVIITGPGGSAGDIVRRVLARAAGARLVLNNRMLAALEEDHRRRDRPLPRPAERLALLPQGATLWTATRGEPAWALESGRRAFVVLPRGVGFRETLERHLLPFARELAAGRPTVSVRTLKTAGVAAAELEERLADWLGKEGDVAVAVVPADGGAWVRLRARGATPTAAAAALAATEAAVGTALGEDCYGRDEDMLEQVVGRLLIERKLTLSVAESCTGGLLGHRLTNIPGSSAYFDRGLVVYSNQAKQELLGVPESVLRMHGAVSGPCAEAMVRGVCATSGSDCGLAITGIAGPDGGTPDKPVGTVFFGLAFARQVVSRRCQFVGDRAAVKWQSTQVALDMLRRRLREA